MIKVIPVFGTATLSVEDVRFVIQNNRKMKKWKLLEILNDQPREAVVKPYHVDYALDKCKTFCDETTIELVSQNRHREAYKVNQFKNNNLPVKKQRKARHDALEYQCSPPLKTLAESLDDQF